MCGTLEMEMQERHESDWHLFIVDRYHEQKIQRKRAIDV